MRFQNRSGIYRLLRLAISNEGPAAFFGHKIALSDETLIAVEYGVARNGKPLGQGASPR